MSEWHKHETRVIIKGLPADLQLVPEGPSGPSDPDRAKKTLDWLEWGMKLFRHRIWTWMACDGLIEGINKDRQREIEYIRCQEDKLYTIVMYMSMYETDTDIASRYPWYREENYGWMPAIPFPFQARMIRWLEDRSNGVGGIRVGWIGKPRRMGATDMAVNYATARWLTDRPYSAKFISRNAGLVYDKGNMDAILQRAIVKLDQSEGNMPIPEWLIPPGWTPEVNVTEMKVSRPDNKNLLGGETTTKKAGRGGRGNDAFLDEAAFMDNLLFIIGAIQATSRTVVAMSSESVETSDDFVDAKEKAKALNPESVFDIDWWEHPWQDAEWLVEEEQRYILAQNHEAFFREVLREPRAGFDGWMYQDAQNIQVLDVNVRPVDNPSGYIDVCIDPGYADETALHFVLMDAPGVNDTVLEAYTQQGAPAEYYGAIISGCNPYDHPQFTFPGEAALLMEQVAQWREQGFPVRRVYGDPYGSQNRAGDDSWYARMIRFWREHNPEKDEFGNPRVIPILENWSIKEGRSIQGRRLAMMHWLREGLQFNDTPQVRQSLLALQRTRWQEGDRRITEMKDAYHDKYSHRRSSLEYGAVNREEFLWTKGERPGSGTRNAIPTRKTAVW